MTRGHCGVCGRQYSECVCQPQLPRCKHGQSQSASRACNDPMCPAHGVQPNPYTDREDCFEARCYDRGFRAGVQAHQQRLERLERVAEAARDHEAQGLTSWHDGCAICDALAALDAPEGSAP